MKDELDRLMTETGRNAPAPQAADLDKETMERLTALGYVGAPVSARKASGASGPLADPKDKIGVFIAVTRAGELVLEEKYAEAVAALESALREEPTIPQALSLISTCYVELGRPEEAKAKLDILLKRTQRASGPDQPGQHPADEGKTDDVIALCKRTLSVDDRNTQAPRSSARCTWSRIMSKPCRTSRGRRDPAEDHPDPAQPGAALVGANKRPGRASSRRSEESRNFPCPLQ
jgi:tetratricopeptide (TPR) repeat protein